MFVVALGLLPAHVAVAQDAAPWLHVLGVAQDAGYPQAGCEAPHCQPGWSDPARRRGATALALIDPAARRSYLFEATPDFPAQLHALEAKAPAAQFAFSGIFLTHAHIGHYTGLMHLGREAMGASGVPVFAMPRMLSFLQNNGPWSQLVKLGNITLTPLHDGQPQQLGSLRVTPFLVPHRDEFSETVGFRIEGPERTAVFIPDIDKWSKWDTDLVALIAQVDYALIDATFHSGDELPGRDMAKIPHPFVGETVDALRTLAREQRNKVWFIHMNHTNPMLDPHSPQSRALRALGYNIAREGTRLPL